MKAENISNMIETIENRHSHRDFEERDVEEEVIKEILKAASYSPSARAAYPWSLIVVRDKETRKALSKVTPYAGFIAESPVAIVVASEETREWIEDCSIVAEHIQLEATEQGLGSCWAHMISHEDESRDSEKVVKELLSLPKDYRVLCAIALGYPSEEKPPHEESELEEREIYDEKYGNKY